MIRVSPLPHGSDPATIDASWSRVLRALTYELAICSVLPAVFLLAYVRNNGGGGAAVLAHANLLLTLWLGLFAFRMALARLLGASPSRWASASLCAGIVMVLAAYYVVVIVGLRAWSRVASWRLLTSYAGQVDDLAAAMGFSLWPLLTAAVIAFAAIAWAFATWPMKGDAAGLLVGKLRPGWSLLLAASLASLALLRTYDFLGDPPTQQAEPVSLTFFPGLTPSRADASGWRGKADALAQAEYRPNPGAARRNVILIVGDCLRADHLEVYGYSRPTTPYLAELVRTAGAQISRPLTAVCSESSCGLMGILRSQYVHEFTGRGMSLTEVLRRHGYAIHLVLGGDHTNYYDLKLTYGAAETYFDGSMVPEAYANDDELVLARTRELPNWDGRPQMLQFHLMSSHGLGKRRAGSEVWRPVRHPYLFRTLSGKSIDPAVQNYYDNGVRQFDQVVRELLAELRGKGYLQQALVVITGDHGEMLGEHDVAGHGNSVHEGALRVPLVMVRYGYTSAAAIGGSDAGAQVDIAPSILHELDMPLPSNWSGQPLQRQPFRRDFAYFQQAALAGLLDYRHSPRVLKYWRDFGNGREFAYDVAADPHEATDLFGRLPEGLKAEWRQLVLPAVSAMK